MAGTIIADFIRTDANQLSLNVGNTTFATINASGFFSNTGTQLIAANGKVSGASVIASSIPTAAIADSAITRAKMGYTGAVLQTVYQAYTPGNISTSTTGSFIDAGIAALSITPTSASSKILIGYYNVGGHRNTNGPGNGGSFYTIYRNIAGGAFSNLSDATYGITNNCLSSGTFTDQNPVNYVWLDSPATTSAVTYKPYYKVYSSSGYFSHAGYGSVTFYAIAMEIAA